MTGTMKSAEGRLRGEILLDCENYLDSREVKSRSIERQRESVEGKNVTITTKNAF